MTNKSLTPILILCGLLVITFFVFYNGKKAEAPVVPPTPVEKPLEIRNELPPQAGLPPAVEAKRQALYKASLARDYEKLNAETGKNFHYSFGGAYEGGFIGYLKLAESDEKESVFDIIPKLLKQPYAHKDNLYTWPSVFTTEPLKWTDADIAQMKTYLTDKQIEDFRQFGGYIYYRIGITDQGDWWFYLAGD